MSDIIIDVAFNFITDAFGDKVGNTKFSGAVKEGFSAAGVDLNDFAKDFFNQRKEGNKNIDLDRIDTNNLRTETIKSDATRYEIKRRGPVK